MIAQERAGKGQGLEALRHESAEKSQLLREQANDLQENARMHRTLHENEEARAHETLSLQASQWKIHCDELTEQFNAERLKPTQKISEKERDMDDPSAKFIEASEKLDQWDIWWQQEGSTAREAKEVQPIDRQNPEGLTTIAEEERRPQPTTPFVQSQFVIPQEFLPPPLPPKFAHKNFPRRANESDESSHTGMDPQAVPTFAAPTTPPSAHKHTPTTMPSAPPSPFAGPWAAAREKLQSSNSVMDYHSCPGSGGISDASTLPMHPPPGMGFATPTPSIPFAYACQPWEPRALHNKLARNKVGSQTMKSGRTGHHFPSW